MGAWYAVGMATETKAKHPALELVEQWEAEDRARGRVPKVRPTLTPDEREGRRKQWAIFRVELEALHARILADRDGIPMDVDAVLDEVRGRESE